MQKAFLDQPIMSNTEVAALLRQTGLDFEAWPQSILPDEMLKAMDAGSEEDIKMLMAHNANGMEPSGEEKAKLDEYRAELIADNHAPRAVLRTAWGLLIGEKAVADTAPNKPFTRYRVEVQCEKGWNNKILGAYCDACMNLLDESLQDFLKRNRGVEIEMADADIEGILELSVFVTSTDDPEEEEAAVDGLANYLAQIAEDGTLDRVISVGCSDDASRYRTADTLRTRA